MYTELPPLHQRRPDARSVIFYKIINDLVVVHFEYVPIDKNHGTI